MARIKAARSGNRHAFESVRDDFKGWRAVQQERLDALLEPGDAE